MVSDLLLEFNRILDNLPLVMPIKRSDQESTIYQHGFHVGLKGIYAGVYLSSISISFGEWYLYIVNCNARVVSINFLGFIISQSKEEKHFIHNHLTFTVKFHKDVQTYAARIVGFEVKPFRSDICVLIYMISKPMFAVLLFFFSFYIV